MSRNATSLARIWSWKLRCCARAAVSAFQAVLTLLVDVALGLRNQAVGLQHRLMRLAHLGIDLAGLVKRDRRLDSDHGRVEPDSLGEEFVLVLDRRNAVELRQQIAAHDIDLMLRRLELLLGCQQRWIARQRQRHCLVLGRRHLAQYGRRTQRAGIASDDVAEAGARCGKL
ncbi:MAG: hypothetical protein WDN69_02855 [Aliidongia sp.]